MNLQNYTLIKDISSEILSVLSTDRSRVFEQDENRKRSVGFIDTNLGIDHVIAVSKDFDTYLYIDGGGAFPSIENNCTGDGFTGIKKVEDIGGVIDKDLIVITDCYYGGLADYLRKKGRRVFGASLEWTRIENDRVYGWKRLKEMGVGVPKGVVVRGLDGLLNYIRKNQDGKRVFFIKISKYRGNKETGGSVLNDSEAMTAITQAGFGPYLKDLEMLVQDRCPGVELGFDAFFSGDFLRPYFYTIEVKGSGTVAKVVESCAIDDLILNKIKPSLVETDYRGNISFEFFYDGDRVYVIDVCSRNPYPCSAIQSHFIKNYADVLWAIGSKQNIRLDIDKKYYAQVGVYTEEADTWRVIHFPNKIRDRVGFRRVVIKDGQYYFVPGDNLVATAVGMGDTPEEAIKEAGSIAEQIECSNSYVPADFFDKAMGVIEEVNRMGKGMEF